MLLERCALWQLTLALWRGLVRNPAVLFWFFGFPLLLAVGLGIAFDKGVPTGDCSAATSVSTAAAGVVGLRYIEFLLPGLIGLNLMNSSLWGVAYTIVLDRKRCLLKQMAATPMRRGDFMAAHLLSRLVLLALEVASLVLVGWLLFDVVVRGSWVALLVVTLLGATAFGGIALVIAARRSEPDEANGWMNAVMLPMWLLSGSFFSYERFPDWLLPINRLLPLTALNDALRAVMTAGEPLARQAPELLVLAAWGLGGFLWARWRFQWQ